MITPGGAQNAIARMKDDRNMLSFLEQDKGFLKCFLYYYHCEAFFTTNNLKVCNLYHCWLALWFRYKPTGTLCSSAAPLSGSQQSNTVKFMGRRAEAPRSSWARLCLMYSPAGQA
jgi:hypothetical protein